MTFGMYPWKKNGEVTLNKFEAESEVKRKCTNAKRSAPPSARWGSVTPLVPQPAAKTLQQSYSHLYVQREGKLTLAHETAQLLLHVM